jgi:Flp pilus assembly protein TadG
VIRDEKGSALVEMALVMPILLLLLCGIVEFGRVFHAYIVVQQAARDAVRYASLGSSNDVLQSVIEQDMTSLDVTRMRYEVRPSESERTAGETVTVDITYDHALLIPYLRGVIPDTISLNSEISMRME